MSRHDDDHDLRAAFDALRDDEHQGVPGFGALLSAPAPRRAPRARPILLTAAAAASVAMVGLVLYGVRLSSARSLEESIAMADAISSWTDPSDEFAALSGAGIREGIPDLELDSLILPEWPAEDAGPTD